MGVQISIPLRAELLIDVCYYPTVPLPALSEQVQSWPPNPTELRIVMGHAQQQVSLRMGVVC
jgi:hypothetical protein